MLPHSLSPRVALLGVLACVCLVATAHSAPGTGSPAGDGSIPWERSLKDALKKARDQHRPLLVDFWAGWCHWCRELDATTYRDPAVVRLAAAFVPVKVDTEGSLAEKQASADFGVETLPTIAVLSPAGHPILAVEKFERPEELAATLQKAGEAAARVLGWEDALARDGDDPAALAGLGAHLVEQKRPEEGKKLLERATTHDLGRPSGERKRTRILLATIHRDKKRYGEAEKLLQAALALRPVDQAEDARALFELGEIDRDKGGAARRRAE